MSQNNRRPIILLDRSSVGERELRIAISTGTVPRRASVRNIIKAAGITIEERRDDHS